MKNYTIAVAGTGYVGLSIATLLSQHHKVYAVDIIPEKVELINNRKSPIQDEYIEKYLAEKKLDLTATLDAKLAYSNADFVVIAAPTNYDSQKNFFDTSAVEAVIKLVMEYNPNAITVSYTHLIMNAMIDVHAHVLPGVDEDVYKRQTMTSFGASGPANELFKHFGFTVEHVVEVAKSL